MSNYQKFDNSLGITLQYVVMIFLKNKKRVR